MKGYTIQIKCKSGVSVLGTFFPEFTLKNTSSVSEFFDTVSKPLIPNDSIESVLELTEYDLDDEATQNLYKLLNNSNLLSNNT